MYRGIFDCVVKTYTHEGVSYQNYIVHILYIQYIYKFVLKMIHTFGKNNFKIKIKNKAAVKVMHC